MTPAAGGTAPEDVATARAPDTRPDGAGGHVSGGAHEGGGHDSDGVHEGEGDSEPRAPALRPFLLTAGRVAGCCPGGGAALPVETQVVTTVEGLAALDSLSFECRDIVALCRRPQSLAEISAQLRLHLNVVRVLAADLQAGGRLSVYVPGAGTARDTSVLRRVIDGLRGIPDTGRAPDSGSAPEPGQAAGPGRAPGTGRAGRDAG